MTRKDFIALADAIRRLPKFNHIPHEMGAIPEQVVNFRDLLYVITKWCHETNPRFNEARFRAYIAGECGPSGGKRKKGAPCPT